MSVYRVWASTAVVSLFMSDSVASSCRPTWSAIICTVASVSSRGGGWGVDSFRSVLSSRWVSTCCMSSMLPSGDGLRDRDWLAARGTTRLDMWLGGGKDIKTDTNSDNKRNEERVENENVEWFHHIQTYIEVIMWLGWKKHIYDGKDDVKTKDQFKGLKKIIQSRDRWQWGNNIDYRAEHIFQKNQKKYSKTLNRW